MDDYDNYTYNYNVEYGDLEETKDEPSQRATLHVISIAIYSISFVLGMIGNGIVIWVTGCKSKKTMNSVWLFNLAMADFVFVLFLPFSIDYIMRDFHWDFGLFMCKVNSFVSMMNMYASVLFLTIISIDRYVALVHQEWSRRHRSVRRAWMVCSGVWMMSAALSCPALIFRDTAVLHDKVICFNNFHEQNARTAVMRHFVMVIIRTTVGFLLPLAAISVTGVLLALKVKRSSLRLSSYSKTVSAVILAFFLCWAPFHTLGLMELSIHSSAHLHEVLQYGFPLATSLGFFNSCINPLLYVLLGKKVRHILKRACLDLTKSSLRELNQSASATEMDSLPEFDQNSTPEEPVASSSL